MFVIQSFTAVIQCLNCFLVSEKSGPKVINNCVSSAYDTVWKPKALISLANGDTYKLKRAGLKIEPCGTLIYWLAFRGKVSYLDLGGAVSQVTLEPVQCGALDTKFT